MKTFDEITRKFYVEPEGGSGSSFNPEPGSSFNPENDGFEIPECWKPKTQFQSMFLVYAMNSTSGDYSEELRAAIGDCLDDFGDRHTITKTEILFDGNLNFTITVGESSTTATSDNFSLATEVDMLAMNVDIAVDGENLPSVQSESYTGMTARLMSAESVNPDVYSYFVRLSNLANTFADGTHHVVLSVVTTGFDLEPKTYKELVLFKLGGIDTITNNKMLPKTPEELAFALLNGAPLEFSDDADGDDSGDDDGSDPK